jgi:hypothetical protein
MPTLPQLSFGGAYVITRAPVAQLRGWLVDVACNGEGLVCDSFVVSLRSVSRVALYRLAERTIACAFVLQALRNSIRETAALYGTCRWYPRRICTPSNAL